LGSGLVSIGTELCVIGLRTGVNWHRIMCHWAQDWCQQAENYVSLGSGLVSIGIELCVIGLRIGVNRLRIVSLGSIYNLESDAVVSKATNCLVSQKTEDCWSTSAASSVSTAAGSPPCCSLLILLRLLTLQCVTPAQANPLCAVGWSLQQPADVI